MKMLEAYSMFEQWHKYKGSRSSTMETYSYIVKRMFIEQFIGNIDPQLPEAKKGTSATNAGIECLTR